MITYLLYHKLCNLSIPFLFFFFGGFGHPQREAVLGEWLTITQIVGLEVPFNSRPYYSTSLFSCQGVLENFFRFAWFDRMFHCVHPMENHSHTHKRLCFPHPLYLYYTTSKGSCQEVFQLFFRASSVGFEPLGSGPSLQPTRCPLLTLLIIPHLREIASGNVAQTSASKIVETAY